MGQLLLVSVVFIANGQVTVKCVTGIFILNMLKTTLLGILSIHCNYDMSSVFFFFFFFFFQGL